MMWRVLKAELSDSEHVVFVSAVEPPSGVTRSCWSQACSRRSAEFCSRDHTHLEQLMKIRCVCVCECVRSPGAGVVCDQTHSSCPCWLAMCSGRRPAAQGLLASAWCWSRSLTVSPWPCLQASVKAVFPSHVWRFTPAPGRTKHTSQPLTSEKKCPMTRNDVLFWDLYLLLSWPVLLLVCGYSESIIFIYLFMSR